jgi:hypothetical protein
MKVVLDILISIGPWKKERKLYAKCNQYFISYIENVQDYIEENNEYFCLINEVLLKGCDVIVSLRNR